MIVFALRHANRRPDPADWLTWRRTLDGWGYSPLDRINRANVGRLRMVWTRVLGPGLQEGTPLVHDGVMYVPATGDDILAVDAKTGDVLWDYRRKLPDGVQPKRSRAIAIWYPSASRTSWSRWGSFARWPAVVALPAWWRCCRALGAR